MLKLANTLWCGVALLLGIACAADIVIYADDTYPPVMYKNAQGQASGVMAQALINFEKFSGKKVQIEQTTWRRAYEFASRGKGGIIGLSKTKQRLALFDYSDPIYEDNINIVVHHGKEFDFHDLNDLHDKLVGVHLGASYGESVDAAIKHGEIKVDINSSPVIRLKKLLYDRIDCAIVSNGQLGLDAIIDDDPELQAKRDQFVILKTPLVLDPLHLGFAKSMQMTEFIKQFNQSLKANTMPHRIKAN